MTGAPIPPGADTVVPFEETDEFERKGRGLTPPRNHGDTCAEGGGRRANLRPAGQDVRKGQLVLERGTLLRPSEVGVLASLGWDTVEVVRRPVVAVIATGDELLEPGEPTEAGKIYNSNSYGVAAAVLRYGGIPRLLGIARDNLESMNAKLDEGLAADVLLTSAGVSGATTTS